VRVATMTGQTITAICVAGVLVCDAAVSSGLMPWGAAFIGAAVCAYGVGWGITRVFGRNHEP